MAVRLLCSRFFAKRIGSSFSRSISYLNRCSDGSIKSGYPDIEIEKISFPEAAFASLKKFESKIALVCFIKGYFTIYSIIHFRYQLYRWPSRKYLINTLPSVLFLPFSQTYAKKCTYLGQNNQYDFKKTCKWDSGVTKRINISYYIFLFTLKIVYV